MTCEACREELPLMLYGELSAERMKEVTDHLRVCSNCALEYDQMHETIKMMNRRVRTEPTDVEWSVYKKVLAKKLRLAEMEESRFVQSSKVFRFRPASVPAWAYGAAAVLILAVGIYVGRTYFSIGNDERVTNQLQWEAHAQQATTDSLETATLAYLERARNLLLGVVNSNEGALSPNDFAIQQRVSRQLIQQANYLTAAMTDPNQQRVRQLLQDLQIILLQLANVEIRPGVPLVELVRQGVDKKSILLKINLEELRVHSKTTQSQQSDMKSHS